MTDREMYRIFFVLFLNFLPLHTLQLFLTELTRSFILSHIVVVFDDMIIWFVVFRFIFVVVLITYRYKMINDNHWIVYANLNMF